METKEQLELRRVGRYFAYTGKPTDDGTVDFGKIIINPYELHPLYERIEALYELLRMKNIPGIAWIGHIIMDIKKYGIHHKVAKEDLIAMNKLYRKYK